MKKTSNILLLIAALLAFTACNDYETYAEKKEKERDAINLYLKEMKINEISEQEFRNRMAKGECLTDTSKAKNEWVLLQKSSIYMQVINDGTYHDENGNKKNLIMKPGETANILCRFLEENLLTRDTLLSNMLMTYVSTPEKMTVTRKTDTFEGSFIYDTNYFSLMYSCYGSASVPAGWLAPLMYLNIGRPNPMRGDEIAKIRIIVPHASGTSAASSGVYPTYYEISYEKAP